MLDGREHTVPPDFFETTEHIVLSTTILTMNRRREQPLVANVYFRPMSSSKVIAMGRINEVSYLPTCTHHSCSKMKVQIIVYFYENRKSMSESSDDEE